MDIKGQARERARPDVDYPSKKIDIDSDVASTDSCSGEDCVSLKQISEIYNKLKSGYDVSKQEISKAKKDGRFDQVAGLGYGEVDVEAFGNFVRALPRSYKDGTFLDLGSGSGKAVLAAAFAGSFSSCIGVEIVTPLCKLANEALECAKAIDEERAATIKFVEGDMFKQQDLWHAADVILVTCTLFTDDMMQQLNQSVEDMLRPGTIVVTTTRRLNTKRARLVSEGRVKYAKGSLLFIVYIMT